MWEIWIAALSAALYFAQIAAVRKLSASQGLAWSSRSGVVFFGFLIFLGTFMAAGFGPVVAVLVGLTCNLAIGGRMLQATRRALRVRKLFEQLKGPSAERALAALDHEVEGLRGGRGGEKSNYDHRARWVLAIASNAARAGHAAKALEWTTRLETTALGRSIAAMHAQHEAAFRIATGDRAGARAALARAPRPTIAPWEDALCALEALLDALEGDAQAGADRAATALAAPQSPARPTWQMARAHGLAKLGALEEARDVLRAMRGEGGEELVRRVVAHAGPASRLAEGVLSEQGAYR